VTRKLRVTVDKSRCVSNQTCIQYAPGAFVADAEGQAEVADVGAASEAAIIEAAYNCPVAAIGVFDAETGEDLVD
jgi:ferredoxin